MEIFCHHMVRVRVGVSVQVWVRVRIRVRVSRIRVCVRFWDDKFSGRPHARAVPQTFGGLFLHCSFVTRLIFSKLNWNKI